MRETLTVEPTPLPPASDSDSDSHAITELTLYIENSYDLVGRDNSQGQSIQKNLARKVVKGTYDHGQAWRLWMYLVDAGARAYDREFSAPRGSSGSVAWISKADREKVAHGFANAWQAQVKSGEVDVHALAGFAPGGKYGRRAR